MKHILNFGSLNIDHVYRVPGCAGAIRVPGNHLQAGLAGGKLLS